MNSRANNNIKRHNKQEYESITIEINHLYNYQNTLV